MSQPLSNVLGIKHGIDSDKPDREFQKPPLPERRKRVRRFGKNKRELGIVETTPEITVSSPARDVVALVLILCGLIAIVTGVGAIYGVWWAVLVFGALTAALGIVIALL